MNLNDFVNIMRSTCLGAVYVYVFDDESSFDSFAKNEHDYELLFTIHSDFVSAAYLKPKYANAKVDSFASTGRDRIAVLITEVGEDA